MSWWGSHQVKFFFHILGTVNPTDFHIFQRVRSTTNQWYAWWLLVDWDPIWTNGTLEMGYLVDRLEHPTENGDVQWEHPDLCTLNKQRNSKSLNTWFCLMFFLHDHRMCIHIYIYTYIHIYMIHKKIISWSWIFHRHMKLFKGDYLDMLTGLGVLHKEWPGTATNLKAQ